MPTPIGHSLVASLIYLLRSPFSQSKGLLLLSLLVFAALLPDVDYYPVLWGDLDQANLNHQGLTHSFFFAIVSAGIFSFAARSLDLGSGLRLFFLFFMATSSHLLLDFLTYDGRPPFGIPLFWPFSSARFNCPVSVFMGFAKGSFADLFSSHNLFVVGVELLVLGIPVFVALLLLRKRL